MTFSVIMPVHNGAGRMKAALKSVNEQTFLDYELIVVCDACEDNSAEIARQYGAKVKEVNYHRDGMSRNAGIDEAKGDWILFIDDDDRFMHRYVFEMLAEKIRQEKNADVICFSFICNGIGYITQSAETIYTMVWSSAWKRSFIGGKRFDEMAYGSDTRFYHRYVLRNPDCQVCLWDKLMYYYNYGREGSLTWQQNQRTK